MSLLDPSNFKHIFEPLQNCEVGYIPYYRDIDCLLINTAAEQLLFDFHIRYREIKPQEIKRGELYQPLDAILVSGGSEMNAASRHHICNALVFDVPVTVLPLSISNSNEDISPYAKVFVRDKKSLKLVRQTELAPELALGLRPPWVDEGAEAGTSVWLRNDNKRIIEDPGMSLGDPAEISISNEDYFGLASKFEHIVTDRLHFAIAGLLVNRRVTLLPDASGNNRAIYETWLKDLGCRWRYRLGDMKTSRDDIVDRLWKRLSSPPSGLIRWNMQPCRNEGWELITSDDSTLLRSSDETEITLNSTAMVIWSLCDGDASVEDICSALSEHYQQPMLEVAKDIQQILSNLQHRSAIREPGQAGLSANLAPVPIVAQRKIIDVDISPPKKKKGQIRWAAHVRGTSIGDFIHYFDFDPRWRSALTKRADPFVLALLPRAMKDGADLRISGAPVDAQLLDHLDEYQRAWQAWEPDRVEPITILAEEIVAASHYTKPALTAFSGGLDSMHTVCRHLVYPDGRRNRKLGAALMACGFDIPINDKNGFNAAIERLRPVTDDAGIDLIEVYTNIRSHMPSWVMGHAAALASVLCLFSARFGTGLIPSTYSYQHMSQWGSNPISDPLLGGAFNIVHDSAALSRFDKLCSLARWPVAWQRLRVCWVNRDSEKNCGHCEKCINLAISMQSMGLTLDCFNETPSPTLLANFAKILSISVIENSDFSRILEYATSNGLQEPWVKVLREKQGANLRPKYT